MIKDFKDADDERREFTRYIIQEDELQVSTHDLKIIGRLKDISKGGLSFQYDPIAGEKLETNSINMVAKDQFFMSDIDCQLIYDIPTLEEGQSFTGAERRQRGVKFVGLSESQRNKLKLLLKNLQSNR